MTPPEGATSRRDQATAELRDAVGGREHEFAGLGLIGLAILLGLAVYLNLAGPLGRGIETLAGWLFGLGRYGSTLANMLRERGCHLLAIDFDPAAVRLHEREGYRARYGDAEDPEFIATLPLERVAWVVSTLRDRALNRALLQGLKQQSFRGKVAISSSTRREADDFRQNGVDLVLVPYADAAKEAADKLVRECRRHYDNQSLGVGV